LEVRDQKNAIYNVGFENLFDLA